MIHTIGDSHSSTIHSGFKDCGNIILSHHVGPLLCYTFGNNPLSRIKILDYNINDNDIVIFCLGEIDCRCHINKYISKKVTYKNIIDNIINNYIIAINKNIKLLNKKLKFVCIYNVVPPVKNYYKLNNKEFPFLGNINDRKKYIIYFNNKLKEICNKNNFIFFDVYEKYSDNEGFLNEKYGDGNVHIKNGIFIKEFINNNLLF